MTLAVQSTRTGPRGAPRAFVQTVATIVTEALAPAFIIAALVAMVAWRGSAQSDNALLWGLVAGVFSSALPFAYVLFAVRRKRLTDRHVTLRAQRPVPILVALGFVSIGASVLARWGAPPDLVSLVATMAVGLLTTLAVTFFWKISIHTAVAAGALVVVAVIFGSGWLALAPLVALVAWARIATGGHSCAQTVAGAALGAGIAAVMFPLLR